MNAVKRVETVLDTVLKSRQSMLLFGADAELHATLRRALPTSEPLDLRTATPAALRDEVERRVEADSTLLLWLGAEVSDATRATISELLDGRLGGAPVEGVRIVAVAAERPGEEVSSLFGMVLAADAARRGDA